MTEKEHRIRAEIIPQLQGLANRLWDKEVPDAVSGRKLDRLIDQLLEILNEK